MKLGGLLLASFLLSLVLAPSPVQAQWCQGVDGPYWCGAPDSCQGICSEPGSDCTTPCRRLGGTWTTCGGGTDNDNDADGVANASDNCICQSNANQADCDLDGSGDVCDAQSVRWVFVEDLGYCDWDADVHFASTDIETYAADRYQDACSGNYCSDKRLLDTETCTGFVDSSNCCNDKFGSATCNIDNQCGLPNCPF